MAEGRLLTSLFPEIKNRGGILLCIKGEATIGYTAKYEIKRGSMMLFNPVLNHIVENVSPDFDIVSITTDIESTRLEVFSGLQHVLSAQRMKSFVVNVSEEAIRSFVDRLKTMELIDGEMASEENPAKVVIRHRLKALYYQECILSLLLEHFEYEPMEVLDEKKTPNNVLPMKFVRLANKDYKQRSVTYYAEQLGVSVGQLNRLVKAHYRQTPHDLISNINVNIAKSFLRQRTLCLKEIAAELGFPDQSTFQRFFKNNTGMTPKEYQEKYLVGQI